jgi:sugar phosphate isomerase/epimerase
MQLGFVSAILPDLDLDQTLAFAAAERFACVEVMCWPPGRPERKYAGVTHLDVTDFTKARADEVLTLVSRHGVSVSALGYYPNPLDFNLASAKVVVHHLKKVIQAAAGLGLPTVNTFVGRDWTRSVDDNWPRFLKTWRPLVRFAEDHRVRIGIENCPMLYSRDEWPGGKNLLTTPTIWRRAFEDIPSDYFGLNYDPSHFALQQMDPIRPLFEFQDRIFHFHAKDLFIDRHRLDDTGIFSLPSEWHQPRIPGRGQIDWKKFMAALRKSGYRGPVCLEVEDETFGRTLEGRKNALRAARDHLAPLIHS